jgi:superfamily II DNA helicase RecQ
MPMRTFMIPVTDGGEACDALNQFMRHVRVLSTERRFVELGLQSFWSILVDYLEVKPESVSAEQRPTKFRNRIDYREVLDPDAFSLFAQLREFRKRLSQEEGVPIYTIFTNEQLAEIAKNRIVTKSGLEKVDGIGGARLSRYGDAVLRFLESQLGTSHEESSKPL